MTGAAGAWWLIVMRVLQGVGGAFLFANSSAILTDAFPAEPARPGARHQHVAGIAGSFLGLVLGGLLAPGQLAPGLPGLGAVRRVRHRLGLPQAEGHRHAPAGQAGLVGQHHLRRRPDRGPGRHHLRHPALRRARHGLDQPVRADRDHRRHRRARRLRRSSSAGSPTRCSTSRCSGSARSPPATSPACWRRSAAAACSSC